MSIWFRLQPENDEPRRLLDPEHKRSERWEGTVYGRCDKWGGEGQTVHECESCVQGRAQPDCCQGSGRVDDSQRDGVSVFPDEGAVLMRPSSIVEAGRPT